MPFLSVISGEESARSRLLTETLSRFDSLGFKLQKKNEGGDWFDLFAGLRTGGLFEGKRIFVVQSAELLGEFPERLEPFIEKDSDCGAVLVYNNKYSKFFSPGTVGLLSVVKEKTVPKWNNQREKWLMDVAEDENINLDRDAASLLVEWIDDPEEIRAELNKLAAAIHSDSPITIELVRQLSLDEGRNCLLGFLDGISRCSVKSVVRSLEQLRQNNVSLLYVITALFNRVRIALYVQHFSPQWKARLEKILKVRNYQMKMVREMMKKYSVENIDILALELMSLSYREKTGKSSGWNEFETIIFSFLSEADGKIRKRR